MALFDPYNSGNESDEETIDSLLLQAYTNTLPRSIEETEESANDQSTSKSAILKGLDNDIEMSDNVPFSFEPVRAPVSSPEINTTNNTDPEDKTKSKFKNRRYYDELDLSLICYNCGAAGHTQFECVEEKKAAKCRECGELGHLRAKCPNKLCYNCLKRGHSARDCKQPRTRICHRCNGEGHVANQCRANLEYVPEKRTPVLYTVGRGSGNYYCFNCGKEGHTGKDCGEPTMNELNRYERPQESPRRRRR